MSSINCEPHGSTSIISAANENSAAALTLDHLAIRINDSHRLRAASVHAGLEHAFDCGQAIAEVNERVELRDWLQANCPGLSEVQARTYMYIARVLPTLDATAGLVPDWCVRDVLLLLAEARNSTLNWPIGPLPDAGHQLEGVMKEDNIITLTAAEDPEYVHIKVTDIFWRPAHHTIRCVKRSRVHAFVANFLGLDEDEYDATDIAWDEQEPYDVWPGVYHEGYLPDENSGHGREEVS